MFASADFLAQGGSPSLDQTVPCQPKLRSKKSRTQLLLSPLVLRHQEKIKEATEPTQSTLRPRQCSSATHTRPHPPTARPWGPALRRHCSLGHTASTPLLGREGFPAQTRPLLLTALDEGESSAPSVPLLPGARLTVCSSSCARASELSSFWGPRRLGSCLGGA